LTVTYKIYRPSDCYLYFDRSTELQNKEGRQCGFNEVVAARVIDVGVASVMIQILKFKETKECQLAFGK
jgi:hypothetical protein